MSRMSRDGKLISAESPWTSSNLMTFLLTMLSCKKWLGMPFTFTDLSRDWSRICPSFWNTLMRMITMVKEILSFVCFSAISPYISAASKAAIQRKISQRKLSAAEYWPTKDDVTGALSSVLRIQYYYHIPVRDIAEGKLVDKITHARLTVKELFEIGKDRLVTPELIVQQQPFLEYASGVEWLEAALQ